MLYHEIIPKVNKGFPFAEYDCVRNPLTKVHNNLLMFSLTIGKRDIAGRALIRELRYFEEAA